LDKYLLRGLRRAICAYKRHERAYSLPLVGGPIHEPEHTYTVMRTREDAIDFIWEYQEAHNS
jgi:hypothetical protein